MRNAIDYSSPDMLCELQEGEMVFLDKGYCNQCLVKILYFYGKHFARIEDEHEQRWDVMIYRLSKP